MKIIISKYQYDLIIESNSDKNKKLVGNMWDEGMDMDEISELIGISKSNVVLYLKDKPIKIDCEFAEKLAGILFWRTDFINKKYSFNNSSTLEFTWGGFSGIIYFTFEDESNVVIGMASPYWNGDCWIPADLQSIQDKSTDEYEEYTTNSEVSLKNVPSQFNSIQEMIDFFNTVYPVEVFKVIPTLISEYT
jgi:hypothetical protein